MKKAKKILAFAAIAACITVIVGCASTKSVITEYDASGKITKKTETSESVVKNLTDSTKNKTVVAWESGWAAYISASTATQEDPTPTMKMFAGKTDKGVVSALPNQQNWDGIAAAINATKYELTVSSSGVEAKSVTGTTQTATKAETETKTEAVTTTQAESKTETSK